MEKNWALYVSWSVHFCGWNHAVMKSRSNAAAKSSAALETSSVIKELQHRPATMEGLPPFTGAVGYCAYDIVRRLENIGEHAADDLDVPDSVLMFFDRVLAFDHLRHQIHIVANGGCDARVSESCLSTRAVKDIARIEKQLATGWKFMHWRKGGATKTKLEVRPRTPKPMESVRRAKEAIAAGDIFQVVLAAVGLILGWLRSTYTGRCAR